MTSLQEVLDRVLRYMVANQENGIFIGTPRTTAEEVAVISVPIDLLPENWSGGNVRIS